MPQGVDNPYAAPAASDRVDDVGDGVKQNVSNFHGLSRRAYCGLLSTWFLVVVLYAAFAPGAADTENTSMVDVLAGIGILFLSYFRRRNIAVSKRWLFGLLLPIVSLGFIVFFAAAPEGWGVHRKFDRTAAIVAAIFIAVIALSVAAVVTDPSPSV